MLNFSVVGFDLDDTLFNRMHFELPILSKIADIVAKDYGIDQKTYLYDALYYITRKVPFAFDEAFRNQAVLPEQWDVYVRTKILPIYRTLPSITEVSMFSKAREILESLHRVPSVKKVLITDGIASKQRAKLKLLGLEHYFDLILISDEIGIQHRKPSVTMFQMALNHFGIAPDQMIYIGDDDEKDGSCQKVGITYLNIHRFSREEIRKIVGLEP